MCGKIAFSTNGSRVVGHHWGEKMNPQSNFTLHTSQNCSNLNVKVFLSPLKEKIGKFISRVSKNA